MKKKIVGLCVCLLLTGIAVPVGESFKAGDFSPMAPSVAPGGLRVNWVEIQELIDSDGAQWDLFGMSVSLSGDTALIGAWWDDDNGLDSGSAFVFIRNGTSWTFQQKLLSVGGTVGDWFGYSVSLDGDNALIGAPGNSAEKGAAYVFTRTNSSWTQQVKLFASDGALGDDFGYSVSLLGDTAVIGAYYDDDHGDNSGSAYVFTRSGTSWTQQAKLLASDGATKDYFGYAVAYMGDTALIGANGYLNLTGAAYVFTRSGTTWTQQAKLLAADGATGDDFGCSVSLSGDTALVGANTDDDGTGSAFVFVRTGTTWTQQAKLVASDGEAFDMFGIGVSLDGDTALVGAWGDFAAAGSAYVFSRTGTTWTEQSKLFTSGSIYFGESVSVKGDTALIGAPGANTFTGSAYIFMKENEPPLAQFSWGPLHPFAGQEITFDASNSSDHDGTITSYAWDWNSDGQYDETHPIPAATHSWPAAGNYSVTLKVTDDDGATGTRTEIVRVEKIPLNLTITISGGLGVNALITNNGITDATDVPWRIHVAGGIFGLINRTVNGTIDVQVGKSTTVSTGMFFGLGGITITVQVADGEKMVKGTQFFIFSIVQK